MINRMTRTEAHALLRENKLARLGCIADGEPYVVPINYVLDGESVLLHMLPGRKLTAVRQHPRVCLQVDRINDQFHWQSVIAYGRFEEITNGTERERALGQLLALFPHLTPVESFIANDAAAPAPIVCRVRIEEVTGVAEG